jgi:hypothetical protein
VEVNNVYSLVQSKFSETIHTVNGLLLFGVGDNVSDESSVDAEKVRNAVLQ